MMVKAPGSHKGSLATVEEGGGEWREKGIAIEVDVRVDGANSQIRVESRLGHKWSAEDFSKRVREIIVVGIVVIIIVGHHSIHADINVQKHQ